MSSFHLVIPEHIRDFLARTIAAADGNEVYFLGRVRWQEDSSGEVRRDQADLDEVDVFARGNRASTPAIIEGAEAWDVAIHNHPGGDLTPSDADVSVAGELGNRQVGFVIIDNDAERLNVVVRPFPSEGPRRVEPAEVEEVFRAAGPLDSTLSDSEGAYEFRAGQLEMAKEVTRALNDHRIVALEAGTGVGKSFAYLVPVILWACRNKRRVVVSTNTINLQEQLVSKDLPFLHKALDVDFTFAIIKGRSNYGCLRKAAEARSESELLFENDASRKVLVDLLDWTEKTSDGSRADLGMIPPADVWELVMSETDKSLNVNCSFYEECFYYKAKRRAFKADIVVANHHLFFADLAVRKQTGNYQWDLVLPGYDRVVFDEAHHLEDVASMHLGVRFSREGIARRFSRLVSRDGKSGVLPNLTKKLRHERALPAAEAIENHFIPIVPKIAGRVESHFDTIAFLAEKAAGDAGNREPPRTGPSVREARSSSSAAAETIRLRFTDAPDRRGFWDALGGRLREVRNELEILARVNDRAVAILKTARIEPDRRQSLLLELTALSGRLDRLLDSMAFFADFSDGSHVRWLEVRPGRLPRLEPKITLQTSPIHVGEELSKAVYEPLKTVVLTSATLSVEGKPDFFASRVGLDREDPERFSFHEHPSPFDFARQVLTLVPSRFPDPREQGFERELGEVVFEVLRRLGGRTFVLFTSYSLLRRTVETLEARLARLGIRCLAQGSADRSELLRRFRSGSNNALFGTDSFWEGVDVKGRALECVILTRLPFRVPTEPIQLARVEDLEKRGVSPFPAFTVPQAVLKFKQGFGRLVRSNTDRGVVLVLDRRIVTKPYGKTFLDSLPPVKLVTAPVPELLRELESFFEIRATEEETAKETEEA